MTNLKSLDKKIERLTKKYDPEKLKIHWQKKVAKELVGRKIKTVRYLNKEEAGDWWSVPIAIQLDNGKWLTPMRDDEGNDGGAIHTTIEGLPCIPTM